MKTKLPDIRDETTTIAMKKDYRGRIKDFSIIIQVFKISIVNEYFKRKNIQKMKK